ncbi:Phospholipase D1 [Candida viswanathii]|uniref:Phospholipase D1 n=1 Tax=Candida viswanathii TaxID=5486 RepID=A0A367YDV3_9ASCO|nr:Phospholipase D1 [Candida viswanathii]
MLPTLEDPLQQEPPAHPNLSDIPNGNGNVNNQDDNDNITRIKVNPSEASVENGHAPRGVPLRQESDVDKIFRSVSNGPILPRPHERSPSPRSREDTGQVIPNSLEFSFIGDQRESRYGYDHDHEHDHILHPHLRHHPRAQSFATANQSFLHNNDAETNRFEPVDGDIGAEAVDKVDGDIPQRRQSMFNHSQTFSSFIPSRLKGRSFSTMQDPTSPTSEIPNPQDGPSPKNKHNRLKHFLRTKRKKGKDERQNVPEPNIHDESENAAIERAEKLLAGMQAGGPAINLMASCLLEDEHGIYRAPLLLSLLGFKVTDITVRETTKNRRFRFDLEYGIDRQRMKWSIERNSTDLAYLAYKFEKARLVGRVVGNKSQPLPKFPVPPIRKSEKNKSKKFKTFVQNKPEDQQEAAVEEPRSPTAGEHDDNHSISPVASGLSRVRLRVGSITSIGSLERHQETIEVRRKKLAQYTKDVDHYLKELIEATSLKPQSNILFIFFELSPLSSLLSYETGYTGKQGPVHISGTASAQGWRVGHFKANDLKGVYERRSEKWMLVRSSYVTYVSDINSTSPLDVFIVDSSFKIHSRIADASAKDDDESIFDASSISQKKLIDSEKKFFPHLKITLENNERKLSIQPKSPREHKLWVESLRTMQSLTPYAERNRFGSFAPIRKNIYAQWFVDGRDHFWAVSSAIEMAKDTIMIHDWWLSPELYLRRPANGNQQYRLDRLLKRKADEGVKIFVVIYRNVGTTVATDSLYTKHSILSLNEENIHVIRSPNQLLQNTYFWAHHEKLCIVDHTYAFLGGIDLCYGRYDTADHVLVDDSGVDFDSFRPDDRLTVDSFTDFQVFPGKDYSNPRVKDFFDLEKPYESMYNRNEVPRMPWHDIHMFTCGQTARDLARHFVQRWNYLIRQKRPSRLTPLLLPPPDLSDDEAMAHGLDGTCEVQLLRSSGNWSLGLKEHEQSIQNAYLRLIETSEHFVYIENQFFVTSCFIDGTEIKNRIGDALVDRIIRAHREGTNWKAIIVIPLMPGFEAQVDEAEGSSVRVIMQCQFMSISRGESSIFAKLRMKGIDPDQYIQFFSLRKWGRIGTNRSLVTEQLYIHAKAMVADDRVAIIGSANINERSMRGLRDSEVAAVVRDNDMVKTTMDGKPFLAGKFAHTLRVRLMREHLGVSIDILDVVERRFKRFENFARSDEGLKYATNKFSSLEDTYLSAMVEIASRDILNQPSGTRRWKNFIHVSKLDAEIADVNFEEEESQFPPPLFLPVSFNNRTGPFEANKGIRDSKKHSYDNRVQNNEAHKKDVYGDGPDKYRSKLAQRARLSSAKFLKDLSLIDMESNPTSTFLPDFDNVVGFLESDDCRITGKMDAESEKILTERNKERWLLLKKISYLQRVAAKEKSMNEEEDQKRVKLGLPLLCKNGIPANGSAMDPKQASLLPSSEGIETNYTGNKDTETVKLSEMAARDIINNLSTSDSGFSNFIDPYEFDDPIGPDFYELRWNEIASRNTELYRMVFHCQPDDYVSRWSDYTTQTELQSQFMKAQESEADYGQLSNYYSDYKDTEKSEPHVRLANNSKPKLERAATNDEYGLLGKAPPDRDQEVVPEPEKLRAKLGRRVSSFTGAHDAPDKRPGTPRQLNEPQDATQRIEEEEEVENYDGSEKLANGDVDRSPSSGSGTEKHPRSRQRSRQTSRTRRGRNGAYNARRKIQSAEAIYDKTSAERLLSAVQGNLVYFPTEWLETELRNNNWFYNTDRLPPMEIYD